MGNKLFRALGVDIAGEINSALGGNNVLLDATLTKVTSGTRTPGSVTAGTNPTEVEYPCKGFIDMQRRQFATGALVRADNLIALLIGDTINGGNTAPEPGDHITIEGTEYIIPEDGEVNRDPDAATYECEVRKR